MQTSNTSAQNMLHTVEEDPGSSFTRTGESNNFCFLYSELPFGSPLPLPFLPLPLVLLVAISVIVSVIVIVVITSDSTRVLTS